MTKRMRALLAKKDEHVKAARAVTEAAEKAGRDITAEEQQTIDTHLTALDGLNVEIEREQRLIDAERAAAALPGATEIHVTENIEHDPKRGFQSFGEFTRAVMQASTGRHELDERLVIGAAAPSTFGNESSGADGGFLVPPEYAREIWQLSLEEDSLLAMTDNNEIGGNSMVFPSDETTPWGSDGVRAYWENEAGAAAATKPKIRPNSMRLHKLMALVPMTDELLEDAQAGGEWVLRKAAESIRWKSNEALFAGTGAGQPMGIFGHNSEVEVAKESAQVADTIVTKNVAKMFARLPANAIRNAIWMVNNDALPQIFTMEIGDTPIFTPPGGLNSAPAGTLLGRPIMVSQHCKTVGDKGDIVLANWRWYRTITKRGGIQTATSMHLYFDAGATAFRATFRVDGQPALKSAITPANGSNSLSPFVFLAARA